MGKLDQLHDLTYEELEAHFLRVPGIYDADLDVSDAIIGISFEPKLVSKAQRRGCDEITD